MHTTSFSTSHPPPAGRAHSHENNYLNTATHQGIGRIGRSGLPARLRTAVGAASTTKN